MQSLGRLPGPNMTQLGLEGPIWEAPRTQLGRPGSHLGGAQEPLGRSRGASKKARRIGKHRFLVAYLHLPRKGHPFWKQFSVKGDLADHQVATSASQTLEKHCKLQCFRIFSRCVTRPKNGRKSCQKGPLWPKSGKLRGSCE